MKTLTAKAPSVMDNLMDVELHALFLDELADSLHAEHQLVKALPKMIKAADSSELVAALEAHLEETKGHVQRLEQVFASLGEKVRKKPCQAMLGIVAEGGELLLEWKNSSAIDAAIIAAGQKVEHYEIASYGTLVAWAKEMGHDEAVGLLQQTLDEEKAADEKLTEIALSSANPKADR